MIRLAELTLRRGAKVLLERVSTAIHPGEKVGLVGANGSGKSSLFALLCGRLHADEGDCALPPTWRVAHVAQEARASGKSALEYVIDGDTRLRDVESALATVLADHDESDGGEHGHALADLHTTYGDAGGYTVTARAETLLLGLGFTLPQTREPVETFSGGWRMRLNLAQALMCPSDLLLLDEPTNHLDLDAIVWLEQWLRRYAGTLLVISHDREFLDAICGVIVAIENRSLTRWSGNYSAYEMLRADRLLLAQTAYSRQQREIAHLQQFVDRFRAKASKAKQAQSRVKAMDRMTRLAPVIAESPFTFRFRTPAAAPDPMLVLDELTCGYRIEDAQQTESERIVLRNVKLRLASGERIGLLGANGQGKSTLIKTIAGTLAPLAGHMQAGKGLAIGYFAQHQVDTLIDGESAMEQLSRVAAKAANGARPREQDLRDYLGSFDFRGDMATAPVAPFSGGEKARLALALIIWGKPNLLLLDEPTNHLDLTTREALTLALAQFEGTLILVSHDRALLRATTDRFLLVADGGLTEFDGDLDDYRIWLLRKSAAPVQSMADVEPKNTPAKTAAAPPLPANNLREDRRVQAAARVDAARERKPIESRIRRIEEQLAKLGEKKKLIDARLAEPDAYQDARREMLKQQLIDQAYLAREIEQLEREWLTQQSSLEGLTV